MAAKKVILMRSLFLLLTLSSILFADPAVERLKYGKDWSYQPIFFNGKEVLKSTNGSGGDQIIFDRYKAIKSILDKYEHPIKVLDIGANNGFFSLQILEDYEAVCVIVI